MIDDRNASTNKSYRICTCRCACAYHSFACLTTFLSILLAKDLSYLLFFFIFTSGSKADQNMELNINLIFDCAVNWSRK